MSSSWGCRYRLKGVGSVYVRVHVCVCVCGGGGGGGGGGGAVRVYTCGMALATNWCTDLEDGEHILHLLDEGAETGSVL